VTSNHDWQPGYTLKHAGCRVIMNPWERARVTNVRFFLSDEGYVIRP